MNEHKTQGSRPNHDGGHRNHGWMMLACGIPILAMAGILMATGVLSAGFLLIAVSCAAMMALMMRGIRLGGPDH